MRWKVVFMMVIVVGCKGNKTKSILKNGDRSVGNFDENNLRTGWIKNYDSATNELVSEGYYLKDELNGEFKIYDNGKLLVDELYENGLRNGVSELIDTNGKIRVKENYFHGLHAGNSVTFKNSKPKYFAFYSLEQNRIIQFDYDSLKIKRLDELVHKYFYYTYEDLTYFGDTSKRREYLLYIPNPLLVGFEYSLVRIDSARNVLSVIQKFDRNKIFSVFDWSPASDSDSIKTAIKLIIYDSINNTTAHAFKVLK